MMRVLIIGGVAGGMSAAAKLKRNLKDKVEVVVFEKGSIVSYGACGIPYYVSGKIADYHSLIERTAEQFAESGITVKLRHEAVAVDVERKTVSVRDLDAGTVAPWEYDKLVVASGAKVRRIPPLDADLDNLYVVRTVEDGVAIRKKLEDETVRKVVVVGAGFIGLEMVDACAKHGKDIMAVEFAARILTVMDPEFTDAMTDVMAENGVDVRVDSRVVELVLDGGAIAAVVVESAAGRETIPADMVLNCAGIVPDTGFIDVDKARSGAIVVNERMETSAPDVYAAGDCTVMRSFITGEHQYAPLGTNANKQGKIVAELIAGKPAPTLKLLGSSAVRLFGIDAAKVGLSESDAQRLNIDYRANRITGNTYAAYYDSGKVMVKLVYGCKDRRILGAQLMGEGVVAARANYFAVAISAGMTVDEFGYLDLCYSPPFSGVWDVSLIAATTAK